MSIDENPLRLRRPFYRGAMERGALHRAAVKWEGVEPFVPITWHSYGVFKVCDHDGSNGATTTVPRVRHGGYAVPSSSSLVLRPSSSKLRGGKSRTRDEGRGRKSKLHPS